MRSTVEFIYRIGPLAILITACLSGATEERVALLKGQDIVITDISGRSLAKLTNDARRKGNLRWLPDGERLSYLVDDPEGAKGRLVVVDLNGKVAKEVPIRRPGSSHFEFRFIQSVEWVNSRRVRIEASHSPKNGEQFDLDVESGEESNWQFGYGGSFVASPDDKHVAYLGLVAMGPDEERTDSVEIDHESVVYVGEGPPQTRPGIRVLAGPVWCSDSKRVAFLERTRGTGDAAVTVLSVTGSFQRMPVPGHILDTPEVVCTDGRVVAGAGPGAVLVDPETKRIGNVTPDVQDRLQQQASTDRRRQEFLRTVDAIVRRIGGREGVGWRPSESQKKPYQWEIFHEKPP